MSEEVLKVLVDKTVDNGKAIREMQEQISAMNPGAVVAEFEKRIEALEEKVDAAAVATSDRIGELETKVGAVGSSVGHIALEVTGPGSRIVSEMVSLGTSMREYVQFFKNPMVKEVHHRHFLGRAVLVLGACALVIAGLCYSLVSSAGRAEQHERNDILWRGALLVEDSVVMRALDRVQRNYDSVPDEFKKNVIYEEERRAELYRHWLAMKEQEGKVHELESKKKK